MAEEAPEVAEEEIDDSAEDAEADAEDSSDVAEAEADAAAEDAEAEALDTAPATPEEDGLLLTLLDVAEEDELLEAAASTSATVKSSLCVTNAEPSAATELMLICHPLPSVTPDKAAKLLEGAV